MDIQEQALQMVQQKGPVIPAELYKELNKDLLTTSALLSELVSNKKIRISSVKMGGSPFYYIQGQEKKLQNFSHLLHDKEKKAYEQLKDKHVLRDKKLEPVTRVALRQIKDFAVPLQINGPDGVEIFWRWYLDSNVQVESLIRKELGMDVLTPPPQQQLEQPRQSLPVKEESPSHTKKTIAAKKKPATTNFLDAILTFFQQNNIKVHSKEVIKKNEIDFVIDLHSSVGELRYYCKAKSKKRSTDTDLSAAFTQGQFRKLPVLYISDGDLTKRAKEMMNKELKGITVRKM